MRLYKIQPAPRTDHITDDGTELTQRPYPIVADQYGTIPEEARAAGFTRVVGFVRDLARQEVDVYWRNAIHPTFQGTPVGMYVIVQAEDGSLSTLTTAVETFDAMPEPRYTEGQLQAAAAVDFKVPTGAALREELRQPPARHRSCSTHCCLLHGCKYGHADCPVKLGQVAQEYPCEECPEEPATPAVKASADELLHHLRECISTLEGPLKGLAALSPVIARQLAAMRTSMDELDRKLTHGHPLPGDWTARR